MSDLVALGIKLALVAAVAAALVGAWHFYVAEHYRADGRAAQLKVDAPIIAAQTKRADGAEADLATSRTNESNLREQIKQQNEATEALVAQIKAKQGELAAVRADLAKMRAANDAEIGRLVAIVNGPRNSNDAEDIAKADRILRDGLAGRLRH